MSFGDATADWLQSINDKHGRKWAVLAFLCWLGSIPAGVWLFFVFADWMSDEHQKTLVQTFAEHLHWIAELLHRIW